MLLLMQVKDSIESFSLPTHKRRQPVIIDAGDDVCDDIVLMMIFLLFSAMYIYAYVDCFYLGMINM